MPSKVDRILSTFTKTVDKLRREADNQLRQAMSAENIAAVALSEAQESRNESERAARIARNLEGILNG